MPRWKIRARYGELSTGVIVDVPAELYVLDDRRKVALRAIAAVEKYAAAKIDFRVNLRSLRNLNPVATLLLVAVLDDAYSRCGSHLRVSWPRDPIARDVFRHIGLCAKLSGIAAETRTWRDNVNHWRLRTGCKVDGAEVVDILADFELLRPNAPDAQGAAYNAIVEAMSNTANHAYEGTGRVGRWWMFSQVRDGWLDVVFCDLGVGIPEHLRQGRHDFADRARDLAAGIVDRVSGILQWESKRRASGMRWVSDSLLIKAALELGRSSTGESHRGRGLPEIVRLIEDGLEREGLVISSGYGSITMQARGPVEAREFDTRHRGTIISWRLRESDALALGAASRE